MISNLLQRIWSIFVLAPIFIFCIFKGGLIFNLFLLFLFIICAFEIIKIKIPLVKFFLIIFFIIFLYSFYNIRNLSSGLEVVFLLTFIAWLSDIGGYVFGKLIGGKKINFISPNKTISGYLGSIFLSQLNLLYISYFEIRLFDNMNINILFLFLCTLTVIFGDLLFSYIKRLNKIKDFSNFIPGHGGVLDRLDGFILLVIAFNTVNYLI
jgi:phosphatidate cytidylyltransferase